MLCVCVWGGVTAPVCYRCMCARACVQKGEAQTRLAISDLNSPTIRVYDTRSGSNDPVATLELHKHPVTVMRYVGAAGFWAGLGHGSR